MQRAMDEMTRRRKIQVAYNKKHNITPTSIVKDKRHHGRGKSHQES